MTNAPQHETDSIACIDLYCDGASRDNPGPAAVGLVFVDHASGEVLGNESKTIGEATNNVAEYEAIRLGLAAVEKRFRPTIVRVYSDSQLVIRQLNQESQVKKEDLPCFRKPREARVRSGEILLGITA